MNNFRDTTDASYIYRESSALSTLRTDSTADTGNLIQVMRDSTLVLGPPVVLHSEETTRAKRRGHFQAV